jgi:hypothetical protein
MKQKRQGWATQKRKNKSKNQNKNQNEKKQGKGRPASDGGPTTANSKAKPTRQILQKRKATEAKT